MHLVIVESPSKAKTINKYLGADYKVIASFGHIRDLPAKDGSVDVNQDFEMSWEVDKDAEKHVRDILKEVQKADCIYLASDPDREGEAIAWHIIAELKKRKKLSVPTYRVTFNEITKNAVLEAMKNPREIDQPLVDAYLARRALDYLVGFNLSPVLWRKLPGAKSAGRVQSVALRLICDREQEIKEFKKTEYWSLETVMATLEGKEFKSKLAMLDGQKVDKMFIPNQTDAEVIKHRVEVSSFLVDDIERKQTRRNPAPAFTTSTLQQEASRKLGFSAKKTMKLAQELYEGFDVGAGTVGLITYMRTDSVALSKEAVEKIRSFITDEYGKEYCPTDVRVYKNKSKNAQEAHEAIRPTDILRTPDQVKGYLDADHLKLYTLIWKRTVACQMAQAVLDKVAVSLLSTDQKIGLRSTGQTIAFAGFIKVYTEDVDEKSDDDEEAILPRMNVGEKSELKECLINQHFTEPPPRYTEASLVKKMEELGIGRPSTYATILSVIQDRGYVVLEQKKFVPQMRGILVISFLKDFFQKYVEYDFTADLENQLDDISGGSLNYKEVLGEFWTDFSAEIKKSSDIKTTDVIDNLEQKLELFLYPDGEKKCPICGGGLGLRLGKFGAFMACSNYPKCKYTKAFEGEEKIEDILLGKDGGGHEIYLKKGPYGHYVEMLGLDKPKRMAIPRNIDVGSVDLVKAMALLSLPRFLGNDPDTNEVIEAGIGRFGPYVKRGNIFTSLQKGDDVLTIDLSRALALIKVGQVKTEPESLGEKDGEKVYLKSGRYGYYLKWGKENIALPKELKSRAIELKWVDIEPLLIKK